MLVVLAQSVIEQRALGAGERQLRGGRRIFREAISQLFDQREPRRDVELEDLGAGQRCHW
ncbi:MAG: hypothetical protein ABIY55_34345 [Kofleriaceae bacterium]